MTLFSNTGIDDLVSKLEAASNSVEFDAYLNGYIYKNADLSNLDLTDLDSTDLELTDLEQLPFMEKNLQLLFEYIKTNLSDTSIIPHKIRHRIFVWMVCGVPSYAWGLPELERRNILVWLFQLLSVRSCQWMFFELYPELRETRFDYDFSFQR